MSADTERRVIRWAILGLVAWGVFGGKAKAFGRPGRLRDATGGETQKIGSQSGHAASLGG